MTNHKHNKGRKKVKKDALKKNILSVLEQNPLKQFGIKQIAFALGLMTKKDRSILQSVVEDLIAEKKVTEPEAYKYMLVSKTESFPEGIIEITKHGYAFVSVEGWDEDIFVSPKNTLNAITGDKVKVSLFRDKKGIKVEGKVTSIVERIRTEFVGTIELSERFAFMVPDNKKLNIDFFIPMSKIKAAKNGDKAVIRFLEWPLGSKNPIGEVIRVLGKAGEHEVEMHAIIEEYRLPYHFDDYLTKEADIISDIISESDIKNRKDFRGTLTFTIDPPDAKDFDDAVSFRSLDRNRFEIGIHIADVTHYIPAGTNIDKEALRRATSVYLVDRTIPMLPEKLSNHLCSLREKEDKLCFSAVFIMDNKASILEEWFGKTIIRSLRRFSYEEVQEILDKKEGDFAAEIIKVNELAKSLREKRYAEGSFSFETEEVKFSLDAMGKPLEVYKLVRTDSHMLIEDLMLLANRKVAEFVSRQANRDFIYRVHDAPNMEKIADFKRIANKFGYFIDSSNNKALAHSFNDLLSEVEGKAEQNFLESLAIRSMAKASYSPDNIGHYGLAFDFYTHFTSPIRRYPDMMVHRILEEVLIGKEEKIPKNKLKEQCKICSQREVNAEQAERASVKYKQMEFMKEHAGEEFDGVISGVIESGLFVEIIENKCEGFVTGSTLLDDFYVFDQENYRLQGYNSKKTYTLGQKVRIKVAEVNMVNRTMDLLLTEEAHSR